MTASFRDTSTPFLHARRVSAPVFSLALAGLLALSPVLLPSRVSATEATAPLPSVSSSKLEETPIPVEQGKGAKESKPSSTGANEKLLHSRQVQGPANLSLNTPLTLSDHNPMVELDLSEIKSPRLSVWLVDEEGRIQGLADQQGSRVFEPATTTKLFSTLLAYDRLAGRLDEEVTIEAVDLEGLANAGARVVGFSEGERVKIEDLFFGAVIDSGGDASRALARLAYGSEADFVQAMNDTAQQLGLTSSHFSNSTGLSAEGDQTTTHDMATIMALAASRPGLVRMMTTPSYTTGKTREHPEGILMESLLFQDIRAFKQREGNPPVYLQGGRPGWSPDGLFTMTSFTRLGSKLLVVVTAGASTAADRFLDNENLFRQAIAKTHPVTLIQPGQSVTEVSLVNGNQPRVSLYLAQEEGLTVALPQMLGEEDVNYDLQLPASVEAPLDAGQEVGKLVVSLNGQNMAEQSLVVKKSYSRQVVRGIAAFFTRFYEASPTGFLLLFLVLNIALLSLILIHQKRYRRRELALALERQRQEDERRRRMEQAEAERRWQEQRRHTFSSRDAED